MFCLLREINKYEIKLNMDNSKKSISRNFFGKLFENDVHINEKTIRQLCDILVIFEKATSEFSKSKYSSIIDSLNIIYDLKSYINNYYNYNDDKIIDQIIDSIKLNINKRLVISDFILLAAILDPNIKNLTIVSEELNKKNININEFLKKYLNIFKIEINNNEEPSLIESPTKKKI